MVGPISPWCWPRWKQRMRDGSSRRPCRGNAQSGDPDERCIVGSPFGTDRQRGIMLARGLELKRRLRAGDILLGAWLSFSNVATTEIMAGTGFDFLIIDAEHG